MYDPSKNNGEPPVNKFIEFLVKVFLIVCGIAMVLAIFFYGMIYAWAWGRFLVPFIMVIIGLYYLVKWANRYAPDDEAEDKKHDPRWR